MEWNTMEEKLFLLTHRTASRRVFISTFSLYSTFSKLRRGSNGNNEREDGKAERTEEFFLLKLEV